MIWVGMFLLIVALVATFVAGYIAGRSRASRGWED